MSSQGRFVGSPNDARRRRGVGAGRVRVRRCGDRARCGGRGGLCRSGGGRRGTVLAHRCRGGRGSRRGGLRLGAARGGRAHPEDPGLEVVVRGEVHRDRAAGLVALRLGVLLRGGHELVREHLGVGVEALVVARRELDGEQVGHDGAAVAEHRGPVVHRPAHRRRDLDGLHLRLERPRECAVDGSLEASLDTVEQSHRWFLLGVGAPIVTAKPWCQRRVLACIAQVDGACDGPVLSYGPSYSTLCERARVAERQTRWLQVPVSERAWGFKSPLAHRWRPESLQVRGPGRFFLPPAE